MHEKTPKPTSQKAGSAADTQVVDPKLLALLVCPLTKGPLEYDAKRGLLISEKAGLAYPIRDGIPVMLPEEALSLDDVKGPRAPKGVSKTAAEK